MEDLISIIVPIYNVEEYLEKCIKSILFQNYHNLQIICINDGSKDSSIEILNKYAKVDKRIEIISRENKGLLASRVEGIKKARGKFLLFVDSDDWIDNDYVFTLIQNAQINNADIVRCNYKKVDNFDKVEYIHDFEKKIIERREFYQNIYLTMCQSYLFNNVWGQLIKTSVAQKIVNEVDTSISMGEDLELNIKLYNNVERIVTINYCGYNYRYNNMSISKKIEKEQLKRNLRDEIIVYQHFVDFIKENADLHMQKLAYVRYLFQINSHLSRLILCVDFEKKEFKNYVYNIAKSDEMKEIRNNITLNEINLLKDKKRGLAKLLYMNKCQMYFWIVIYIYATLMKR